MSSLDTPPTSYKIDALFLPEWVTEIYYGGTWYQVKEGTYKEIITEDGETVVYRDPFSDDLVIITQTVMGWKVKTPEPEEPKAEIIPLKRN